MVNAEFDQELRLLTLRLSASATPLVLSAHACQAEPRARAVPDSTMLHVARKPHVTGDVVWGSYIGTIRGPVLSYSVELHIAGDAGAHGFLSVKFRGSSLDPIPMTLVGHIVTFDPTEPEYMKFLTAFGFKRWSNHLLTFHQSADSLKLMVGWNEYVFARLKGSAAVGTSSPSSAVSPIVAPQVDRIDTGLSEVCPPEPCRTPKGTYSPRWGRYSSLRLTLAEDCADTGNIIVSMGRMILPGSSSYPLGFSFSGTNFKFDGTSPAMKQLGDVFALNQPTGPIHCVHHDPDDTIELTLDGAETIMFYKEKCRFPKWNC